VLTFSLNKKGWRFFYFMAFKGLKYARDIGL
jgi:hypothetical protein